MTFKRLTSIPMTSFVTMDRKQSREEAQAAPTGAALYPKQAKPLNAHMFLYGFKSASQLSFKLASERALMKVLAKHRLPYTCPERCRASLPEVQGERDSPLQEIVETQVKARLAASSAGLRSH